ncbi:MAG TPA: hypothetical protein VLW65_04735 [Bryobacteraceae bacterium]|nr:hypothetical protein [Bryobacteraceae bacterium]
MELRERVAQARRQYESVLAESRKVLGQAQDVGLSSPDGISAVRNANRMQQDATERYAAALKALSEFVLDRTRSKCS